MPTLCPFPLCFFGERWGPTEALAFFLRMASLALQHTPAEVSSLAAQ